ncbi:MAG: hypothetical protein ACM3X1_06820 [Ignavibacteriales bacterium]
MKYMSGEYIGDLKGKVTGRVLDAKDGPTSEISVSREGKVKGVEVTDLVTYCSNRASDSISHG